MIDARSLTMILVLLILLVLNIAMAEEICNIDTLKSCVHGVYQNYRLCGETDVECQCTALRDTDICAAECPLDDVILFRDIAHNNCNLLQVDGNSPSGGSTRFAGDSMFQHQDSEKPFTIPIVEFGTPNRVSSEHEVGSHGVHENNYMLKEGTQLAKRDLGADFPTPLKTKSVRVLSESMERGTGNSHRGKIEESFEVVDPAKLANHKYQDSYELFQDSDKPSARHDKEILNENGPASLMGRIIQWFQFLDKEKHLQVKFNGTSARNISNTTANGTQELDPYIDWPNVKKTNDGNESQLKDPYLGLSDAERRSKLKEDRENKEITEKLKKIRHEEAERKANREMRNNAHVDETKNSERNTKFEDKSLGYPESHNHTDHGNTAVSTQLPTTIFIPISLIMIYLHTPPIIWQFYIIALFLGIFFYSQL